LNLNALFVERGDENGQLLVCEGVRVGEGVAGTEKSGLLGEVEDGRQVSGGDTGRGTSTMNVFGKEGDGDWRGIGRRGTSFVDPVVESGPRTTCVAGEGFLNGAESPASEEKVAYSFAEVLGVEIVQVDGLAFWKVLSTG
jgi:hypothetical protein